MTRLQNLAEIERIARSDEWDEASNGLRARYIQVLRSILRSKIALPATKARARRILEDKGIPASPPSEKRAESHPDPAIRRAQDARYRGLVRKRREELIAELRTRPIVQIDDGPRSLVQAAEDIVKIGEAVMISDEMIRFTRGNCKAGETKRRIRRVIRLGSVSFDEERI